MQKDFLDELMEELQKLKKNKKETVIPVPPAPHEVFGTIAEVAKKHNITADEMRALAAMRPLSQGEVETLNKLDENE